MNSTALSPSETPSLVFVRSSPIHGTGVFATRDICAGDRLLEYKGERISKSESARREAARHEVARQTQDGTQPEIFLFELDAETDIDGDTPENTARFINHSCEENCEVIAEDERLWIYARRDIPAGEELTFDYAFPLSAFLEHPCCCGAAECAGFIVARHERRKLRRMRGGKQSKN
jgi:SET domain-containing protein